MSAGFPRISGQLFEERDDTMATTMTASIKPVTDGQIKNLVAKFRDAARKHGVGLDGEAFQHALGVNNIGTELFASFRTRVEAISSMIVRRVKVDRERSPKDALKATGRALYVSDDVVKTMPKAEGDEVDVFFFKIGRSVSCVDLIKEYELRGLAPDHYAQSAVNETDPAFADEHPNGTQWQNAKGEFCCLTFRRWYGKCHVYCSRNDYDWNDYWWFAGVPVPGK